MFEIDRDNSSYFYWIFKFCVRILMVIEVDLRKNIPTGYSKCWF